MSLPQALPPIVARQSVRLQDVYLRACGKPQERMTMIWEFAQHHVMVEDDQIALAVHELRHAYQDNLPAGHYRNLKGYTFEVSVYGEKSTVTRTQPPLPGLIWTAYQQRLSCGPVAQGYHFLHCCWQWGPPTPPTPSRQPEAVAAKHPVPIDLPGATFRGVLPEFAPPPIPGPCPDQGFDLAAALSQHLANATSPVAEQQALYSGTPSEPPNSDPDDGPEEHFDTSDDQSEKEFLRHFLRTYLSPYHYCRSVELDNTVVDMALAELRAD